MVNWTNTKIYLSLFNQNQLFKKFHETQWGPSKSRVNMEAQVGDFLLSCQQCLKQKVIKKNLEEFTKKQENNKTKGKRHN